MEVIHSQDHLLGPWQGDPTTRKNISEEPATSTSITFQPKKDETKQKVGTQTNTFNSQ